MQIALINPVIFIKKTDVFQEIPALAKLLTG